MIATEPNHSREFRIALREAREAAGLTITELARRLGRTQSYVSQLESGALHAPDDERIEQIAGILGCDADALMIAARRIPPRFRAWVIESWRHDPQRTEDLLKQSATGNFPISLNPRFALKKDDANG